MTRRGAVLRLVALLVLVGLAILIVVLVGIPDSTELRSHFAGLGATAPVLFVAVYALATLSPLPKSVFTLTAGAVFGLVGGLLIVVFGACAGAVIAFYLARGLGRDGVQRLIGVRADRFNEQLARRGFLTILLTRLIPFVPFTVVNYAAGLTAIRVRVFLAATALGMLPSTTAYVALGAYGSRPGSWPFWAALGALALLTVLGVAVQERQRRQRAGPRHDQRGDTVSETPSDDGLPSTLS